MSKNQPDERFPIVDSLNATETEWMSIAEAAKYGSMSLTRIYSAIDNGLISRVNPISNIKEVPKEALEEWFCPFKGNIQYNEHQIGEKITMQRTRINHLRSRIDQYRSHIDDLQETVYILKRELENASQEKKQLLDILADKQKQ